MPVFAPLHIHIEPQLLEIEVASFFQIPSFQIVGLASKEVDEAKGAVMRINFTDARRGSKQADLCDACAGKMPGQAVARRGRRPKTTAAA